MRLIHIKWAPGGHYRGFKPQAESQGKGKKRPTAALTHPLLVWWQESNIANSPRPSSGADFVLIGTESSALAKLTLHAVAILVP